MIQNPKIEVDFAFSFNNRTKIFDILLQDIKYFLFIGYEMKTH